jgi:hypothetical protein
MTIFMHPEMNIMPQAAIPALHFPVSCHQYYINMVITWTSKVSSNINTITCPQAFIFEKYAIFVKVLFCRM